MIRLTTHKELTRIITEAVINNTSKINKFSPNSIGMGFINGIAKVGQKALADIAISVNRLFPETASGDDLDSSARLLGVSPRRSETLSSTQIKLIATPGTIYPSGQTFSSVLGIGFTSISSVTVGDSGVAYIPVRSTVAGENSNSLAFEISLIQNPPTGHIASINEFNATGGRDVESDEEFRQRIGLGCSIAEVGTLNKLAAAFALVNDTVLRVFPYGRTRGGKMRLGVASVNGQQYTQAEFDAMLAGSSQYFSLSDITPTGSDQFNVQLENIEYQFIDLDFRMEVDGSFDYVNVLREIQTVVARVVDFRFWVPGESFVQWEDLLNAVRGVRGVISVPDRTFLPRTDIQVSRNKLPRFRSFTARDLQGNVIVDQTNITPLFYPRQDIENVDTLL